MRLRYCTLDDLTFRTLEGLGRRIGRGACVDFDEVIGQTSSGDDLTIADALGEHAAAFGGSPLVEPSAQPSPALETDVADGTEE